MITAIAHKNLANAEGYFSEHLSRNDYYAAGEVRPGQWIGAGSERLDLVGDVQQEAFVALCNNRHPGDDVRLTPRSKAEGERRVFYDFTCSAPKSVSILAVTFDDVRLVAAHEEAARVAFRELERFAGARIRLKGDSTDRLTGNLVAAAFLHSSSRALDPQLHTHFTVFNATWDPLEKRWKALQAGAMYRAVRFATQVYRNDLARRLHEIGYRTVSARDGFEIEGVPESVMRQFSKRSVERDRVVREMEARLGRSLTRDEVSYAVHHSRARKLTGISSAELRLRQWNELSAPDRERLQNLRNAVGSSTQLLEGREAEALEQAMAHVFERRSVVARHEVLEAALGHRHGALDLDRLKEVLVAHPELVSTERGVTTRAILEQELDLILEVRQGKGSATPIHPQFRPAPHLGADQVHALRFLLQSSDRVIAVRGLAGTGKSTLLKELARAGREAGVAMKFCAPTAAAADVLRADGLEAVTVARWQLDPVDRRAITIVDEAGAVGIADMHRILRQSGRVILCGDTGQHASVARGDALRVLEDHSTLARVELSQIRRQRTSDYRQAVQRAARRDAPGAWDLLERMGAISELPAHDVHREGARRYVEATQQKRTALLVAPTWAEIDALTACVRGHLRESGAFASEDRLVPVLRSASWTEAQRADRGGYRIGQWIRFHHARDAFARDECVEVVGVGQTVSVRREDGTVRDMDPRRCSACIDVGERQDLPLAVGDRLLLRANAPGLTHGEIVELAGFDEAGIRLKDGRVLPPRYRTFTHGYAVTSHGSQGKTVDEVILVATARSLPAVHREQFYVSISRGRDRCRILTDDKSLLRNRVAHSSHRVAAVEDHPRHPRQQARIQRGIAWLRDLTLRLRRLVPNLRRHRSGVPLSPDMMRASTTITTTTRGYSP